MYAAKGCLLRTSIVLGMVAAVVTVLYFTPVPDQRFLNCSRPCHEYDWPMICRVKLTLVNDDSIIDSACENCTTRGEKRIVLPNNRQLLQSSIQVCQNDILVVDVINKKAGQSVTIHWRGQPQNEAPTMDGVPMVTQCPISSYTTFQYKFRASSPGTHLWHAHAGSEIDDGLFGALIVRQPQKLDVNRKLYDIDDEHHVILVSKSSTGKQSPASLLINGISNSNQNEFKVTRGNRYRFRAAYLNGPNACPITLTLQNHLLKVIALDGNPITSYEVGSITLTKGERVDFILKANQPEDRHTLKVVSNCKEGELEGRAVVVYDAVSGERKLAGSEKNIDLGALSDTTFSGNARKFDTSFCESKLGYVCISDVHSLTKIPKELATDVVDKRFYFGFGFDWNEVKSGRKVYNMNNISFTYPSSPLLTQRNDVNQINICDTLNKPKQCENLNICECVHMEQIPMDASVELVLADQGGDYDETVFHLHGYKFYLVGHKKFETAKSMEDIKQLDKDGKLMKRNYASPVLKDTIRIPKFGVVALRFIANNPGYWMLRDEHSNGWSRGLDVVLQVGENCDMVSKPSDFPTCGSWVGPDFFLI